MIALIIIAIPSFSTVIFSSLDWYDFTNNRGDIINKIDIANIISFITLRFICVLLFIILKIVEFFIIIIAANNTSNGEKFKYPLTINIIK